MAIALLSATAALAKDIKTFCVTTNPQMHCANCENKIKNNLRFEKGVKDIATDIPSQTVTVSYDGDKTNEANLTAAFGKIGYQVTKKQADKKDTKKAAAKKDGTKKTATDKKASTKTDAKKGTKTDTAKKAKKARVDGNTGASQQRH